MKNKLNLAFVMIVSFLLFACSNLPSLPNMPALPGFEKKVSTGTGFFVDDKGHLLTAYHVIKDKSFIYGKMNEEKKLMRLNVIKIDEKMDIALLQMEKKTGFLSIADWDSVPVGLEIFVIGFPLPKLQGSNAKITQGIINAKSASNNKFFQYSAGTQKGNSGGPVISSDGLVLGMVLKKLGDAEVESKTGGDSPQNINYAINSKLLHNFLNESGVDIPEEWVNLEIKKRPFEVIGSAINAIVSIRASEEDIQKKIP